MVSFGGASYKVLSVHPLVSALHTTYSRKGKSLELQDQHISVFIQFERKLLLEREVASLIFTEAVSSLLFTITRSVKNMVIFRDKIGIE